eukprot:CAMPEP_0201484060 /NCGR_PEP_ID=MMETSP0151_2-20130828/8245_1 /ASSEMBLY_ACC=CAM_ASM_000257 /TAXON_ID=200890 /ORGANISM="Paramoeba atlantica, Strain 621/1 / CCAP 1560/9" /LENGTH=409 /DNA_ID=CAMNT_0047867517 /DNA_START=98 /DNA_END=1327 /DNA_ORIENTATION=+
MADKGEKEEKEKGEKEEEEEFPEYMDPHVTENHRSELACSTDLSTSSPSLRSVPQAREEYRVRVFAGNGNLPLAQQIASWLGVHLEQAQIKRFNDGETSIQLEEYVRGSDVFVIQSTSPPLVNDNLMELLLLLHTLLLSSARRVTAVVPYLAYGRQNQKIKPRVPISASAVAQLLEAMRPSRIVSVELHCGQIQGFFHNTPVDNLLIENELVCYLKSKRFPKEKLVIASPDGAGVTRANSVADEMGCSKIVTIMRRRIKEREEKSGVVYQMELAGDVKDSITVIVDDLIDTAGTMVKAASLLKENGAMKVYAVATHGLFSGDALKRINESCIEEVSVCDSIPQDENVKLCPKLRIISIAPLLAEAIRRIHNERSLSSLFSSSAPSLTLPPPSAPSSFASTFPSHPTKGF